MQSSKLILLSPRHRRLPFFSELLGGFFVVVFTLSALLVSAPSLAQEEENVLQIQNITLSPNEGPEATPRKLKIAVQLKPGFKAYSDKFKVVILEPYPTTQKELVISPLHDFYDKFSRSNKKGIKEQGEIETSFEIQEPLSIGEHTLSFDLHFQACSETVCYFPQSLHQKVDFKVLDPDGQKGAAPLGLLEENFQSAQSRGLPYLFLFVFLAGILTSLTPCLLPMLPLTIAVIGKGHSHDDKLKKFFNALTYVLGIATTYSLLGLAAASSGALFGNILSQFWVQVGFGLAFIAMGLAQFGLFEFQTPLWLQNRFHQLGNGSGGIFVSGLLSGFIASPCVGPVLVGILTFIARSQDRFLGFGLMFFYALGVGQLLIILGVSSSLLYRFPKSPWLMKTSKTLLGLALIASGAFYLSLLWPTTPSIQKGPQAEEANLSATLPWQKYSEEVVSKAKSQGRPLLIDFYADWCLACHELEAKTFGDPGVISALNGFDLIRFDATESSALLDQLKKTYGIVGLPTILFFDGRGQWLPQHTLNEFESPAQFQNRLKQVKDAKVSEKK